MFGLLVALSLCSLAYEFSLIVLPDIESFFSGILPDVVFDLAGLLMIARGIRGQRGWLMIGVGAICWASGDMYWTLELSTLSNPPVPSLADAGYLLFCPLAFVGILSLLRRRTFTVSKTLIADALAAALAVGGVAAALVLEPVLAHANGGALATLTNLAYPLVDMALLGLIVGALALSNWKLDRMWLLLGLAVVVFWVADSLYLVDNATNTYTQTTWYNALWYIAPVIMAWAAWVPDRASQPMTLRVGVRGIVLPLGFSCTALGTLVWSSFANLGIPAIALSTLSVLVSMGRLGLTWRENASLLRTSQREALTDALTGLANRRALSLELARRLRARDERPAFVLAMFDLNGFKHYNDRYGHPTGDALLQRLSRKLEARLAGEGIVYRMGGDEFCAVLDGRQASELGAKGAATALSEQGEGFEITCSYGALVVPDEADTPEDALRIADQRMYAQKHAGRTSATQQLNDVLLRVLAERDQELGSHLHEVANLAAAAARALALPDEEVERIRQAAALHDVGKIAIPDAILENPGPLSASEREFIHRHTIIGERIIGAAPVLRDVALIVRSSHENFDGSGYPDGLAGEAIPVASRIIAVCDAYQAMTSGRPYRSAVSGRAAVAELRRCAGSQFDPEVVDRFCRVVQQQFGKTRAA